MNRLIFILLILSNALLVNSQEQVINHNKIKEDLNEIINDIAENYTYLEDKNVELSCIRAYYEKQISNINTEEDIILFFEYLLNEFYDNHLILNTNTKSSFRLFSPFYATLKNSDLVIANIWQNEIENLDQNLIGAKLVKINGVEFEKAIEQFPTYCNDKNSRVVKEWIANKILAGCYNQSRILILELTNGKTIEVDLDKLKSKNHPELITAWIDNKIGIVRINNSLGNNNLINQFDETLEKLIDAKGLIIDLRNTVSGGNSYVARGIMGRFIDKPKPYQKHFLTEQYDENPAIERSWVEYVNPRKRQYKNPVLILVGRWTGSMGEGLAIGFEAMGRAEIIGSEMMRLAGEVNGFSFKNQQFGYQISTAKLFHINGTPREKYIPTNYVEQTTIKKDETLEKAIEFINQITE